MLAAEIETTDTPSAPPPFRELLFKPASVEVERRADGSVLIRQTHPADWRPRSIAHLFVERAEAYPDRPYLMQREPGHGPWKKTTYGEALRAAKGIAQGLLDRGMSPEDAVLILSANSTEHALMMLGCYIAGVPAAPISPAYSLLSTDHEKLRHAARTVRPKAVFAQAGEPFERAFAALRSEHPDIVVITADGSGEGALSFADLAATQPGQAVQDALDSHGDATVAKYLFTSGSTGMPKCVPQTHGVMTALLAGQTALDASPSNLDGDPPLTLEWMPWSHISGGNVNFNNVLRNAGTLYLDEGRPAPGMFETTIKNLYEVSPRLFGSAPIAFSMLAGAMEADPVLRKSFFKNLECMMYGGATLSDDVYDRLQALAIAETGKRMPLLTMYGATETQGITMVHWECERVGLIGLPIPGLTLKLVPNGDKMEVRVKGPTVTTGYYRDEKKTAEAFDEQGFYKLGDAARFVDPEDPAKGLIFDGRVTEDFKLDSGTWVSVGTLRPDLIAACSPFVADAVICGQDKAFIGALLWPSAAGAGLPPDELIAELKERIWSFNAGATSSRRIYRFKVLKTPPSLDAGEITDKGYVNQRAAQAHRAGDVASLFAKSPDEDVITP